MAKTILITGASSGIGASTAKLFLSRGWNVGLIARREDKQQAYPSVRRWAHLERLIGGTLISLSQMEDRFRLGIERQDVRLPAYRLHFRGFPERFEVRPAKRV